ncbi:2,3-epoxybenzoyl-CoA dihydrolase [Castellaniella defragrans]|uniref:Benzoyl-CoA-dihydrodiol lyase n=1 Tax=Castellaniella defragrans TaxID=75697 RepID=A0A7W9TN68_CASDE|nr:2,3-epoxybenzoyl-CoA dihydrolase [Castellaniella defragrans]KAB0609122.1 benzoyl-CoA-dihydrodiol lyase [Castellaniella defragrans]MBB6083251.1 benzoyl-CoA-dihydrodiol lyase [Castellaniella defragrans]
MTNAASRIEFRTDPSQYRHWVLSFDGPVATLAMDVAEDGGLKPGYKLKLNSYDLGVDIELHDALQRIRFEHPEVGAVVITSLKDRIFCSGANIFMLGLSSHAWKVNFCKFTNETRNGIEDSSRHGGPKFLAALNGACAGGGYELALACDEILLIDDNSSSVSLPEVPLLGVLPGTGGLTRVTDKRKVRHDHADIFCTLVEGVRGQRAKAWRLVDDLVKPARFHEEVGQRARALAAGSDRPAGGKGVPLTPLARADGPDSLGYRHVEVRIDRAQRVAYWLLRGPEAGTPDSIEGILAQGADWWPLAFARELDDAILQLRTNEPDIGTWVFRSAGDPERVRAVDEVLQRFAGGHWFVRETLGMLRRTLARLDVTSRSLFALIEPGSCFVGTLLEVALACDRSYMLDDPDADAPASVGVTTLNFGHYPMVSGQGRLRARFHGEQAPLEAVRGQAGAPLSAAQAEALGLVTFAVDSLDWESEIRLLVEERAALSPDALTGLEANLRFGGEESMETRVFGRLTAWQNWIFYRPNASGDKGALKLYGKGEKADFDWNRV